MHKYPNLGLLSLCVLTVWERVRRLASTCRGVGYGTGKRFAWGEASKV